MKFVLGFKARVDPLACMLHCLHATESSDSPLVCHLVNTWEPEWQPCCSNPHTCKQALAGLESGVYCGLGHQSFIFAFIIRFKLLCQFVCPSHLTLISCLGMTSCCWGVTLCCWGMTSCQLFNVPLFCRPISSEKRKAK